MEKTVGAKENIPPATRVALKDIQKGNITSTTRIGLNKIRKEKAYEDFWHKVIALSFFAAIFGMLILRLILPVPAISLSENRELQKMPSADLNNIFFGKFTIEFEDYFADTFPLRDPLIDAGDYVSYLFKIPISGVDSIVVLDENIMEDTEDADSEGPENEETGEAKQPVAVPAPQQEKNPNTGEPTPQPQEALKEQKGTYLLTDTAIYKEVVLDPEFYGSWAQGINRLAEALPGKRIIVMSPPNSFAFYADSKYRKPENDQKAGIEDIYGKMAPGIYTVDTYPYLDAHKGEYIYFRTDHHWTALGAYYGYAAFCEATGIDPEPLDMMQKNTYEKDFLGSNYKQLKNTAKAKLIEQDPDHVDYYIPPAQCRITMYEKVPLKEGIDIPMFDLDMPNKNGNCYLIFLGGDYPSIKITTDAENGRSIVLLKDSYANAFTLFLTANYQNIYLIDFRDYNAKKKPNFNLEQFVKKNNIDDVLLVLNFDFTNNPEYVSWYLKALP